MNLKIFIILTALFFTQNETFAMGTKAASSPTPAALADASPTESPTPIPCSFEKINFAKSECLTKVAGAYSCPAKPMGAYQINIEPRDMDMEGRHLGKKINVVKPDKKTCTMRVAGTLSGIYYSALNDKVMTTSYIGNNNDINFFDPKTCHSLPPKIHAYGAFRVSDTRLVAEGRCESMSDKESTCDSAQVFELDSTCTASFNDAASRAFTKKEIGVEFKGKAVEVVFPKTKKASLLPKDE